MTLSVFKLKSLQTLEYRNRFAGKKKKGRMLGKLRRHITSCSRQEDHFETIVTVWSGEPSRCENSVSAWAVFWRFVALFFFFRQTQMLQRCEKENTAEPCFSLSSQDAVQQWDTDPTRVRVMMDGGRNAGTSAGESFSCGWTPVHILHTHHAATGSPRLPVSF